MAVTVTVTGAESKRRRACTPRSRTGCATCRKRRVKCGEERPQCQRCMSSGWSCPGYSRADQSEAGNEHDKAYPRLASTRSAAYAAPDVARYELPFKVPGSREERRALHYFNVFAVADLTGPLPNTFWSRTILQRCQHEAPLRHAAAALGQLHVEYMGTPWERSFEPGPTAMQCYGRAVKSLRNYIGQSPSPDHAMVLMCSAIFFCFELLNGDHEAAGSHVENGLRILQHWHEDGDATCPDQRAELIGVFTQMDLEASLIDDSRCPVLRPPNSAYTRRPQGGNLEEIHRSLVLLLHPAFAFLIGSTPFKNCEPKDIPPLVITRRRQVLHQLDKWDEAANEFEETSTLTPLTHAQDQNQRATLATCRLHGGLLRYMIQHFFDDDIKAASPDCDVVAEPLLELARIALECSDEFSRCSVPSAARRFSLHTGVVGPIFTLAVKVTSPRLRKIAIDLLHSSQGRKEGFWDGTFRVNAMNLLLKRADLKAKGTGLLYDDFPLEWMAEESELNPTGVMLPDPNAMRTMQALPVTLDTS